jgi:hypothetical protein
MELAFIPYIVNSIYVQIYVLCITGTWTLLYVTLLQYYLCIPLFEYMLIQNMDIIPLVIVHNNGKVWGNMKLLCCSTVHSEPNITYIT